MARVNDHIVIQQLDDGSVVIRDEAEGAEIVIPVGRLLRARLILDRFEADAAGYGHQTGP